MAEKRLGRQTPTISVTLPYTQTKGFEAVEIYNQTGRTAQSWQELLLSDIMAYREDGLWTHSRFGYSVPRRNGKNEVVAIREFWGILNNERILHTAHRTTTSSSASKRLARFLDDSGYREILRPKKGEIYEKSYSYSKQFGLERITILDGDACGVCDFRTRTSKGGLGEGFDLLIIDEAQEYQDDQESSLKYVVSDSKNPQTLFCGTPPTAVSSGTVFPKMRDAVLQGETDTSGWAEWSVDEMSDPKDRNLWYECNPSMGYILTERSVADEVGSDEVDFNIQRLGLWLKYNQHSAITETEWARLKVEAVPQFVGELFLGIKYGHDAQNVCLAVAVKTVGGKIFVECIDCRPQKAGNDWLISFIRNIKAKNICVDGSGAQTLETELKDRKLQAPHIINTREVIEAAAQFEQAIEADEICHNGQPSLVQSVTNSEHRAIRSDGGFGYKSIKPTADIALLESAVIAFWACKNKKERKIQRISY